MDSSSFLEEIKPIILKKIKQYGRYIRGYEFNDLLNEGYATALEAVDRWRDNDIENQSNIITWAWLRIDCRFKELGKIGFNPEDSLDALEYDIGSDQINAAFSDFFETGSSPEVENTFEDEYNLCLQEVRKIFKGSQDSYDRFLTAMLENSFCPIATAKQLNITTARVSQVIKKFKDLMDNNASKKKAA